MMIKKTTLKSTFIGLLYLAPMLIILIIFNVFPILDSFAMSFYTKYNFYTNHVGQIGLGNFKTLFSDPNFWLAVKNTLIFVIGVVPISICLSLAIALLINHISFLAGFFKTIYFLPFVTSTVAISLVWQWIYNDQYGLFNLLLRYFGISPIDWLNDPNWSMVALVLMTIWKGLGFNIILFLAGLSNIDRRYEQVARIDGASRWQTFRYIIFPLLSPMTFLVTVMSIISGFKVFDEVFVLFGGSPGPGQSTLTLVFYLYQKFYTEWQYGLATASGVILFFLILVVTIFNYLYSRKHIYYV